MKRWTGRSSQNTGSPSPRRPGQGGRTVGFANLHYLRIKGDRTFLIVATYGKHRFLDEEAGIRDLCRDPQITHGYSVSYRQGGFLRKLGCEPATPDPGWHSKVQISRKRHTELKAEFVDMPLRYSAESLGNRFFRFCLLYTSPSPRDS